MDKKLFGYDAGGARKGAPKRVTVWFVIEPWGADGPTLVSVEGTQTAVQIRLDKRPQGIYWSTIKREHAHYTALDAVRSYHSQIARKLGIAREQVATMAERLANAETLLHSTAAVPNCGACGKPVTEGQHPGCYTTNVPEEVQA